MKPVLFSLGSLYLSSMIAFPAAAQMILPDLPDLNDPASDFVRDPASDFVHAPVASLDAQENMQEGLQEDLQEPQAQLNQPTPTPGLTSPLINVNQLRDVQPGDWAYEALRSLVEDYGCLVGYPDQTFRGNRATTRYEFAAGLNACLDQIIALFSERPELVARDDFDQLQRLIQEFQVELDALGPDVAALEERTALLEANQFSLTTRLNAEAIIGVNHAFGELGEFDDRTSVVAQNRVRLNFDTSFTGNDLLRTRLTSGNAIPLLINNAFFANGVFATDTQEGRFTYDGGVDNTVNLGLLSYRFPVGQEAAVTLFATGGQHHHYADTVNPLLEGNGGGLNALSRFSERNPIYRIGGAGGAGVGFSYQPSNSLRVDLGYLSDTAATPRAGAGLFNGNYSALGQVVVGDRFRVGLTYVHAYESRPPLIDANRLSFGGTGTSLANLNPIALFGVNTLPTIEETIRPVVSNSYGIETALTISPNFVINGWVGKTSARLIGLGDADIWNFALGLAVTDLGREGSLAGLSAGAAPTLRSLDIPGGAPLLRRDFAYQVEGFYRYPVNENVFITPGVIWLLSPNQNADNRDVVIGTLRTTFVF